MFLWTVTDLPPPIQTQTQTKLNFPLFRSMQIWVHTFPLALSKWKKIHERSDIVVHIKNFFLKTFQSKTQAHTWDTPYVVAVMSCLICLFLYKYISPALSARLCPGYKSLTKAKKIEWNTRYSISCFDIFGCKTFRDKLCQIPLFSVW